MLKDIILLAKQIGVKREIVNQFLKEAYRVISSYSLALLNQWHHEAGLITQTLNIIKKKYRQAEGEKLIRQKQNVFID